MDPLTENLAGVKKSTETFPPRCLPLMVKLGGGPWTPECLKEAFSKRISEVKKKRLRRLKIKNCIL
jgi:hypothetical protein